MLDRVNQQYVSVVSTSQEIYPISVHSVYVYTLSCINTNRQYTSDHSEQKRDDDLYLKGCAKSTGWIHRMMWHQLFLDMRGLLFALTTKMDLRLSWYTEPINKVGKLGIFLLEMVSLNAIIV